MTTNVDIVNKALQFIGSRTTVDATELANETSNEAIQANISLVSLRDELLRMAPWNCGTNCDYLTYITSTPGTPENTSAATALWARGQPIPPWAYEYQYPSDCLKPLWVVPQYSPSTVGSIPISPVQWIAPVYYNGPPVKYKVATDKFYGISAAAKVAGGSGYVVGDQITLAESVAGIAPIGAPAKLLVATLAGSAVATVTVVPNAFGSLQSGSYFSPPSGTIAQSATTGVGSGATFTVTPTVIGDQRVILTNQETAALMYVKRVTDPNVMDEDFQIAWALALGARLALALTGDKSLANMKLQEANAKIISARTADGNEGITVNDVTPDWLRVRGAAWPGDNAWTPNGFNSGIWGGLLPLY